MIGMRPNTSNQCKEAIKMGFKTPEEIQQEKKREERRLRIKNDIALIISGLAMLITAIAYILFILLYKN